jgi:hypothetical protein
MQPALLRGAESAGGAQRREVGRHRHHRRRVWDEQGVAKQRGGGCSGGEAGAARRDLRQAALHFAPLSAPTNFSTSVPSFAALNLRTLQMGDNLGLL